MCCSSMVLIDPGLYMLQFKARKDPEVMVNLPRARPVTREEARKTRVLDSIQTGLTEVGYTGQASRRTFRQQRSETAPDKASLCILGIFKEGGSLRGGNDCQVYQ